MKVKEMSDEDLKDNAQELHTSIYVVECFGSRDLLLYEQVSKELAERGYEVKERKTLSIKKEE